MHTDTSESAPEAKPRRSFNSVRLVRQDEKNVIRAFVHSTQTVMTGSTLKMQLAENCLTDDGQRIRKGTPVFGEVMKIDGERVLVRITSVNLGGNILPFEKEVYSRGRNGRGFTSREMPRRKPSRRRKPRVSAERTQVFPGDLTWEAR